MPFTITRLDERPQRQGTVVKHFFRVSNGESSYDVSVGIPEQAYFRLGEPTPPTEVWHKLAEEWLQRHLNSGEFNPFTEPPSGSLPPVTLAVADHWKAKGELP